MHHEDYSKPLSVIFMCKGHHSDLHTLKRREEKMNMRYGHGHGGRCFYCSDWEAITELDDVWRRPYGAILEPYGSILQRLEEKYPKFGICGYLNKEFVKYPSLGPTLFGKFIDKDNVVCTMYRYGCKYFVLNENVRIDKYDNENEEFRAEFLQPFKHKEND